VLSVRQFATAVGLAVLSIAPARRAGAQPGLVPPQPTESRMVPEIRVDGFAARAAGAQLGLGVAIDAGTYTRLALVAGAGAQRLPGGAVEGVQRLEGVARFHVDPFRQARHGVYVGGGLSVRHVAGGPLRPLLVALLGVEGPPHGGVAAAVEAGVGGGARVGVAVRRARRRER
jgi:hypothetical protein